ncbi:unnamed protein product [Heterobilharzia americana]|nr:unnamed protein product [Heterobilharzia americana]
MKFEFEDISTSQQYCQIGTLVHSALLSCVTLPSDFRKLGIMDFLKRSKFDKLIEKATSEMLIESDIESTITICDVVRSQEIS